MPTYDYRCQKCEHHFQERHKIADMKAPEADPCPICGEHKVKKIITGIQGFRADMPPKLSNDFRETMRKIRKGSGRGCKIPDY